MAAVERAILEIGPAVSATSETSETPLAPVLLFERLARDPSTSVDKIERLMALWERNEARTAATLFHTALSQAQQAMRPIGADATNPQTHSRYASYAALDRALRPIYTAHGFALSFNTGDAPEPECVRVLCDVTHQGGHSKTYKVDMPADGKGARGGDVMTKTHATGSAVSYGMRYLLKMIFNVAVGEHDDDGNAATAKPAAAAHATPAAAAATGEPIGYPAWLDHLRATAALGTAALETVWSDSARALRHHLTTTNAPLWAEVKAIAARRVQ